MKIRFAICDDESAERDYLAALVRAWTEARGVAADLSAYESAESLLFAREGEAPIDVLLLDIQMRGMDGIRLARHLREGGEAMQIVFVTGFADFIAEGYDVSALHYLMKPVRQEKLFEVLDRAMARLSVAPRTITFPKAGGDVRLRAEDIWYAEVLSHTVVLYHRSGQEEFRMRFSDMERLLGDGFFRCHRSYIVGLHGVRRVTRQTIILDDGREIPLSRDLYDAAMQAFIAYH